MPPLMNFAPIPRNTPAFVPTSLTGLQLWLDSTDASTVNAGSPANNDPVTAIADKSGHSNNFTGAGTNPVYVTAGIGSKPSLSYPTAAEWLDGGTANLFTAASGYSIFFVFKLTNISPGLRSMGQFAYLDAANTPTFFFGAANALIGTPDKAMTSQGSASWGRPGYPIPASTPGLSAVYSWFYNGAGVSLANYSAQAQFVAETPVANALGGANSYANYIGNYNGVLYGFLGLFSEILIYNRQLTSTEIAQVNTYLQAKYSL